MEVFDVNEYSDSGVDLKSEKQIETLYNLIAANEPVLLRWVNPDGDNKSTILYTEALMGRIKDGRFVLTSTQEE